MTNLFISCRNPLKNERSKCQFWLNDSSKELFQFTDKWISLTEKYFQSKIKKTFDVQGPDI